MLTDLAGTNTATKTVYILLPNSMPLRGTEKGGATIAYISLKYHTAMFDVSINIHSEW